MRKLLIFLSLLVLVTGMGTARASTITFITQDFNQGMPSQMTGGNLESVQDYAGRGPEGNVFSGNFLRNASGGYGDTPTPTILTLTGLPAHTSVSLSFLLAVIDSWDGTSTESFQGLPYGPDYFNVSVDTVMAFQKPITNYRASQGYLLPPGVQLLTWPQQLGFNADWLDSAYDLGLDPALQNIPHTATTLTVSWFASGAGWQGGMDESWALDNVRVDLNGVPVPLPPTAPLLGCGLLGLGLLGFRRMNKA